MVDKPKFKTLDLKKGFSTRDVSGVKEDENGYFRGILDSIELIEAEYIEDEAFDFSGRKKAVDEGKKIQLNFKFHLYTDTKEIVEKSIRTGTTFNKKIISQTYKSRGNKVMNTVFNKFTEMCLRLGFITPDDFKEYDGLITKKIDEVIKSYNDRKTEDKTLIAGKYIEGNTYNLIDWLELVYVNTVNYNQDIPMGLKKLKELTNKNVPKEEEDKKKK